MKMYILVLRDIKANYFLPPMFVPNIFAAQRDLADELQRPDNTSAPARHPEDFELWQLGEYDTETARFEVEHDGSAVERKSLGLLTSMLPTKNS